MRFFKRESKLTVERPTPEQTIGKKIDLNGKPFTTDLIDRDELNRFRYIVFENADPTHIPSTDIGADFGPLLTNGKNRREGIDFPHKDKETRYTADGLSYLEPVDVLILHSIGQQQKYAPINDPMNPEQKSDRKYVEPYTFVCDAEELWKVFVTYMKRKNPTILERLLKGPMRNQAPDSSRMEDQHTIKRLREDIDRVGEDKVGDEKYSKSPWKQLFFDGFFGRETFYGPEYLSREQVREFILFAVDSGHAYLHSWKPNQVLVFDNLNMMHGAFDLTGKGGDPDFQLDRAFLNWEEGQLKKYKRNS